MIRNLRRAGALVASALAATLFLSASAQGAMTFTAGASSGTVKTTQTTENVFTLPAVVSGKFRCKTVTEAGSYSSSAFTELEVSPTYTTCLYFGFLSGSVQLNGCKYRYKGEAASTATMDIVCPAGKDIEIHVGGGVCTVHLEPQTGRSNVSFATNNATVPDDVNRTFSVAGIHYTVSPFCTESGEEETATDGELTGASTVQAFNSGGTQVSLTVD